jgi:putative ABC transport system permease protein
VGRQILAEDTKRNNQVCVLGADVSKVLGAAGRVGQYLRLDNQLYKIVGILESAENAGGEVKEIARENSNEMVFLSFPLSFMSRDDSVSSTHNAQLNQIVVKVADNVDVIKASEAIDRLLYINHHNVRDYSLVVPRQLLNQSLKTQAVFNLFLAITGGISLFVGGIGIMNIMLANVSERKREIGIRRAVGATKSHIVLQFLTESVLLTLVGAVAGLFLGFAAVLIIEQIAGWAVQVTMLSIALPFGLAIFAGVFFGLYPAIHAANLEPINALKSL